MVFGTVCALFVSCARAEGKALENSAVTGLSIGQIAITTMR